MMLQVQQLAIRQGTRQLLLALDWQVNAGEVWWLAGRNGCGKSTLLATLAARQTAQRGRIRLQGEDIAHLAPAQRARLLALLPQHSHDAFDYRVCDLLLAARYPWPDDERNLARLDAALDAFDLGHLAQRPLQALSGGERQRVALAGVMMQDSALILLDEPTNSLDLAHQAALQQQIRRWQTAGKAVVVVSHDLVFAPAIASHALLLDGKGEHRQYTLDDLPADSLADVLGYPLTRLTHAGQTCFLPGKQT